MVYTAIDVPGQKRYQASFSFKIKLFKIIQLAIKRDLSVKLF